VAIKGVLKSALALHEGYVMGTMGCFLPGKVVTRPRIRGILALHKFEDVVSTSFFFASQKPHFVLFSTGHTH